MIDEDKRVMLLEFSRIEKEQKGFRRRVAIIVNLLMPGSGFYIYSGKLKVSLIVFAIYTIMLIGAAKNITRYEFMIYLVTAVVVKIGSTIAIIGNN
ncbi:hypothetical protein EDC18_10655 [Natranaerovirga pectinivora]|uniref:Uncharacterized protein n=1 Tax=Natranaerovirga pectinivora TaxID=682400 RepID=A0A4R3MNJ7_9FIRM|nr:hypothetical protein [Natranaerovirga pectinivora]TCT14259.1 hypothetical protein EDC18_10655 [Natranaerovirga pectinivora]